MKTPLFRSHFVVLMLLAAAYFAAGKFGLSLAHEHPSATVVWPSTGIAIASLLLFGWRMWPAIFVGAFLVNITTAGNWITSLGIATGNTLEGLAAAALLNRFANGRNAFDRVRDVFGFILLAAMASTTISATFGVGILSIAGFAAWEKFGEIWTTWWLGDAVGAAIITPLIVAWSSRSPLRWTTRRGLGAVALFVALIAVSEAIFGGIFPSAGRGDTLPFLAIPILVWIGLRFGHRESATAMFLMSIIAVSSVMRGVGPFVSDSPHQSLVSLQAFLGVVAIIAMVIAAEICERRLAEERLDTQQATARILGETTSVYVAIPRILETICEKLRWDIGAFWNVEAQSDYLECQHVWVSPRVAHTALEFIQVSRETRFQRGIGLPGRAWQSGHVAWIEDVVADANFPRAPVASRAGLCSAFAFPVVLRDRVLAVVELFSREIRRSDPRILAMIEAIGKQIGLMIERTEAAAELEHRKADAEAANKAKDNFLAMLSHELRTPLTPILSAIDQLDATLPATDENRELAATIRRNVEVEARLIDDLLDVTRLGRGKIELRCRPVDAHQCVKDAIALCGSAIFARKITVKTIFGARNSWVHADPMRIQQIVWNVLQNAVKFSPPNSAISVISENGEDGRSLRIRISDQGVGIDQAFLGHVFEPFMQAENALLRRYGGLGLGLSISKALAEMHEGTLAVSSPGRDQGATLVLSLPTIEEPSESTFHAPAPLAAPTPGRLLRILLVDDHRDTREGLERLLRRKGHHVQSAEGMLAALELASAADFDMLISDLGLPDGTGYELVTCLHQRRALPAIAISGFGMDGDISKSKASGFSAHLVKPIEFADLEAAIAALPNGISN